MKTDFVVIGSGLSGLTSAIVLSEFGDVLLVTKKGLSDSATDLAQGGIATVSLRQDSFESHIKDTLIAGAFQNNKKNVDYLVKNANKAILFLEKCSVSFDKSGKNYSLGREGGHSFSRIIHSGDITGNSIEKSLINFIKKINKIHIWENMHAVHLIVKDRKCFGVTILKEGVFENIFARATILCTGGLGQLFKWTTNPEMATGDGIALAYKAGCKISDLEFIQFHPTALKFGKSPLFLLSEALRGEGAKIVKEKEERFLDKYDPRGGLAARDIVSRAVFEEQQKGHEIFLDIRHKGRKFLQKRFPNIYKEVIKRGFDLSSELIPITPAAHYSCGGIAVDAFGRSSIENLFAFGEVSDTGVHGANRLASNSLLEAVVFPMQLYRIIKAMPKEISEIKTDMVQIHLNEDKNKAEIQDIMWENAGIIRKKKGLEMAYDRLKSMSKTSNMVLVSQLIIKAALLRRKSLGAHYRED